MNKPGKSRLYRTIAYLIYLPVVVIVCLEIILRIYYPFPTRIRGDRFELSANLKYRLRNDRSPRLDSIILHNRNSIGFRGADPNPDMSGRLSILAIGGSTTECTYLSEGRTWVDQLGQRLSTTYPSTWINNAGIDGHSTFGHLNLLHYYLPTLSFRPKIALFLVGANDVNRQDLSTYDPAFNNNLAFRIKKWAMHHLETVNLISDLKNSLSPPDIFPKNNVDPPAAEWMGKQQMDSTLKNIQQLLPAYRARLCSIIDICKQDNIRPVFITQPLAVDSSSPPGKWKLFWLELQPYNQTTRKVASEKGIPCIDLAQQLPADSALFYDMLHFTNKGAERVSDIIYHGLQPWLDSTYTQFRSPSS